MPPPPLPIRHALITGGSRGIGLATARLFAAHNYRCTLIARNRTALSSALASLPSSHLPDATPHQMVVGDIAAPKFWTPKTFEDAHGPLDLRRIDVLVNCAGVTQSSLLMRTQPEELHRIVDTNLTAMMAGTRFLLWKRYLRAYEGDGGCSPVVINVASLLGVKGGRGAVAYAASKAGVIGFTRALAEELSRSRIRVNAIVPGYITTDMTADLEASEDLLRKIPAGRLGTPEEVADAALFLAKNQYANNCILNLDGGLSAT